MLQLVYRSKRERFGWWIKVFKDFVCSHLGGSRLFVFEYLVGLGLLSLEVGISGIGISVEVFGVGAEVR